MFSFSWFHLGGSIQSCMMIMFLVSENGGWNYNRNRGGGGGGGRGRGNWGYGGMYNLSFCQSQ
jgi:hypothetical protein